MRGFDSHPRLQDFSYIPLIFMTIAIFVVSASMGEGPTNGVRTQSSPSIYSERWFGENTAGNGLAAWRREKHAESRPMIVDLRSANTKLSMLPNTAFPPTGLLARSHFQFARDTITKSKLRDMFANEMGDQTARAAQRGSEVGRTLPHEARSALGRLQRLVRPLRAH